MQRRLKTRGLLLPNRLKDRAQAAAESQALAANRLQQEANDLKRAEIEHKHLEYQRRRELGQRRQSQDAGAMAILEQARLKEENATLTAKVSEQDASLMKLRNELTKLQDQVSQQNTHIRDLQQQADELASIKTAVHEELKAVCNPGERMAALRIELDSLRQAGNLASLERMKTVITELKNTAAACKRLGYDATHA